MTVTVPKRQRGHRQPQGTRNDNPMKLTLNDAKTAAQALRRSLAETAITISHNRALEIVAQQLGYADWNTASAFLTAHRTDSGPALPVLRVQDEALVNEFYLDYLGFSVEWEHRFEPDLPLYLRIRRGETLLDLSQHHGDGTPGTVVWISIGNAKSFLADISSRSNRRLRPGIDRKAPGGPTVEIADPFGNRLRFCEASI